MRRVVIAAQATQFPCGDLQDLATILNPEKLHDGDDANAVGTSNAIASLHAPVSAKARARGSSDTQPTTLSQPAVAADGSIDGPPQPGAKSGAKSTGGLLRSLTRRWGRKHDPDSSVSTAVSLFKARGSASPGRPTAPSDAQPLQLEPWRAPVVIQRAPPPDTQPTLCVRVLYAADLPRMDTFGQNDPYCVVRVTLAPCSEDADKGGAIRPSSETPNSTVSQQTGVADDGGVDPVWGGGRGEQLRFELDEAPLRVELLCFDRDVGSADDIIGEADIYIEVR